MAIIRHAENARPIRLAHFTPAARHCWCWMFLRPVLSLSGIQQTITGEAVDIGAGSTAWESVKGAPVFETREAAGEWADAAGFRYDVTEV